MSHGSFSGNPKTEWLVDPSGADRDMALLEDFWYVDPAGRKWMAHKGSTVNGASIPRPLWSTVGSPYTDDYRRASVVHDIACGDPAVPRKDADVMFYHACLAGGCAYSQAYMLYLGVRLGAWSSACFDSKSLAKDKLLSRGPNRPPAEAQFLQSKFEEIACQLKAIPDGASAADLDAVIDKHIRFPRTAAS